MMQVPPEVLSNWPRLRTLSEEVSGLEKQHAKATGEVSQLRAQLPAAQEQDLDRAARAVREGKDGGEPTNERKVQRQLEAAQRDELVLQRAVQAAQSDRDAFVAKHKAGLYRDVQKFRNDLAAQIAQHASAVLPSYGRYEDLRYVLKGLQPPVEVEDWTGEPNPNSVHIIGVHTRGSQGPDRGEVEAMLSHLISLGSTAEGAEQRVAS